MNAKEKIYIKHLIILYNYLHKMSKQHPRQRGSSRGVAITGDVPIGLASEVDCHPGDVVRADFEGIVKCASCNFQNVTNCEVEERY